MRVNVKAVLAVCMLISFMADCRISCGYCAAPEVKRENKELNIPVLMYHEFREEPVPAEKDPYDVYISIGELEENIKALLDDGYTFISFEDLNLFYRGEKAIPEKSVILTCDDGYISNYRLAYPVFQKYGVKAAIFVVDSLVGRENYFTWEQAKEMENSGLVDIYTHGMNHQDYTKVPPKQLVDEVTQAHENIQAKLGGERLKVFAYPYGTNTEETRKILKEHGFELQILTRCGHAFNTGKSSLTEINRIKCKSGTTGKEIIKITGAESSSAPAVFWM